MIVREVIHHGHYHAIIDHTVPDDLNKPAVKQMMEASPYAYRPDFERVLLVWADLNVRGTATHGWSTYELIQSPQGDSTKEAT